MKKYMFYILILIIFIPTIVNAEKCDKDKISISSITIENKYGRVTELEETTASGKNINMNLSMNNVGDNIEYKIVIKNESEVNYELDKNSFNRSSNYIDFIVR